MHSLLQGKKNLCVMKRNKTKCLYLQMENVLYQHHLWLLSAKTNRNIHAHTNDYVIANLQRTQM